MTTVAMYYSVKPEVSNSLSEWVSQELSRSDRPDLSSASAVVSGGEWEGLAAIESK